MLKKLILTYYYIWLIRQFEFKNARDRDWFTAFCLVFITFFAYLVVLIGFAEVIFDFRILRFFKKGPLSFLLFVIQGGLFYFLLFHIYGASKIPGDPIEKEIRITNRKKKLAFLFFAGSIASVIIGGLFRKKILEM